MMLLRRALAIPSKCLLILCCILCCSRAYSPQNISNFPRPSSSTAHVCGKGTNSYICDPNRLLRTDRSHYKRLLWEIQRLRDRTPCFCGGCSRHRYTFRTLVLGIAIADRIFIPPNTTNRNHYLRRMAHRLRVKWALGLCDGSENDAFILYERSSDQLVYSFGSLVAARLGTQCIHWIENHSNFVFNLERRLVVAVNILRNAVHNPCCGRPCLYLNVNWYKMLAWVVGGVVLLSALTFFGRRVWARNMYVRTRVRSSSSYPAVGIFGGRQRCGRNGGSSTAARNGRVRSAPGSVLDPDISLPPDGAHVLYSTNAPPPYPGHHGLAGALPMPVQQPPPYTGKPPAYADLERHGFECPEAAAQCAATEQQRDGDRAQPMPLAGNQREAEATSQDSCPPRTNTQM